MPSQTVHLRPVSPADAELLCHVANHPLLIDVLAELPTTLEDWRATIAQWSQDADEGDYIIVRSRDALPVGWLAVNGLAGNPDMAWLKFIALLPDHWGNGYASSAIAQLKTSLAARGITRLRLWTDQANTRAHRCYARHGFRVIEQALKPAGSRQELRLRLLMECEHL